MIYTKNRSQIELQKKGKKKKKKVTYGVVAGVAAEVSDGAK